MSLVICISVPAVGNEYFPWAKTDQVPRQLRAILNNDREIVNEIHINSASSWLFASQSGQVRIAVYMHLLFG